VFGVFDLGPLTNWAWFGVIPLLPALAPIAALLQMLDGWLYLRLGALPRPPE
jgi:hypothetical protein